MEKDLKQLIAEMDAIEQDTDEALTIRPRHDRSAEFDKMSKSNQDWAKKMADTEKNAIPDALNAIQDSNVQYVLKVLAKKAGLL